MDTRLIQTTIDTYYEIKKLMKEQKRLLLGIKSSTSRNSASLSFEQEDLDLSSLLKIEILDEWAVHFGMLCGCFAELTLQNHTAKAPIYGRRLKFCRVPTETLCEIMAHFRQQTPTDFFVWLANAHPHAATPQNEMLLKQKQVCRIFGAAFYFLQRQLETVARTQPSIEALRCMQSAVKENPELASHFQSSIARLILKAPAAADSQMSSPIYTAAFSEEDLLAKIVYDCAAACAGDGVHCSIVEFLQFFDRKEFDFFETHRIVKR